MFKKMSDLKTKPVLTLSVAADLLKVHPRTLMFYEKESLITPARTKTGRRLFSQADLSLLQFIRYLTEKRRVNTAGVGIILDILEMTKTSTPKVKQEIFPEFKEKELI